jgi:hypothetical protein
LFGLLLLLGVVALLGLKPWETSSLGPDLSVSPGLGAGLDDAAVVAQKPSPAIADARVAASGTAVVAGKPVAYEPARPVSSPVVGVSQGRAVEVAETAPAGPPPVPTQPVSAPPQPVTPSPAPSPPPSSPPVLAGVDDEGGPGHPGTSGSGAGGQVPPPACEGDEYAVTVSYELDEATGERLPTEILIRRIESDGSAGELHLEGDLTGYEELIAALVADGGCVEVEFVPSPADEEGVEEAPEEILEAGVPGGEALEPVLP